jgi:hypothetical protein
MCCLQGRAHYVLPELGWRWGGRGDLGKGPDELSDPDIPLLELAVGPSTVLLSGVQSIDLVSVSAGWGSLLRGSLQVLIKQQKQHLTTNWLQEGNLMMLSVLVVCSIYRHIQLATSQIQHIQLQPTNASKLAVGCKLQLLYETILEICSGV